MTTYVTITAGQIDGESPLDETIMAQLRDNPIAITEGAIGAPRIVQGALNTASGSVSDASNGALYVLPGGEYGFYPRTSFSLTAGSPVFTDARMYFDLAPTTHAAATYIYLTASTGALSTFSITSTQRYIQASPPYDMGDGVIGRFIFAKINKASGKVEGVYQAPEAPWHYNGPTKISGALGQDGKKYRERKDMRNVPFTKAEAMLDPVKLAEYSAAFAAAPAVLEEITQPIKDADMHLIPRPMEPDSDSVVVMLDPVSDFNHQLCEMCQHDEFNLNELLHNGLIKIDKEALSRSGPPGVDVVGFGWK